MPDFITKDKKVIPLGNSKGIKKDDLVKNKDEKTELNKNKVEQLKKKKVIEPNEPNEIGLTKHRIGRGFNNGSMGTEEQRKLGNELLAEIVTLTKKQNPNHEDWKLHSTLVLNEYNGTQRELAVSAKNIRNLIEWSKDKDPKTWKWSSPFCLDDGTENSHKFVCPDSHNLSFISDAWKNQVAITVMSPEEFMELADPSHPTYELFVEGDPSRVKMINNLTEKMNKGQLMDTPFLSVDENLQVKQHEGRHRALSAIRTGIKKIPVYVYGSSSFSFSDSQLEQLSRSPRFSLRPARIRS